MQRLLLRTSSSTSTCLSRCKRWREVCTCIGSSSTCAHRFLSSAAPAASASRTEGAETVSAAGAETTAASSSFSDFLSSNRAATTAKLATDDIGVVTRLSVSRNSTIASSWETVPNWCALCIEPVNTWDQHVGKREHICLEMTFNSMVSHPRAWAAVDVWRQTELFRTHYARRPRGQPRTPSANVCRKLRAGLFVPAVDSPVNMFFEAFDKMEPAARREEILLLSLHLQEKGFLSLSPEHFNNAVREGQFVITKEVMPLMARIFPDSEVRNCSAMTNMVSSAFNAQTTFFLCGLEALLTPELLRHFTATSAPTPETNAAGDDARQDSGNSSSSSGGEELLLGDDLDSSNGSDAGDEDVPNTLRINTVRAILGSLRWALEPDVVPPPPALYANEMRYAHYTTIAARVVRLLVSDLVFNRVSEYVTRLEGLLRSDQGIERMRHYHGPRPSPFALSCTPRTSGDGGGRAARKGMQQLRVAQARSLVPSPSNQGIVEFTNGAGLCAANVHGTAVSDNAIRLLEMRRANQLKTRRSAKACSEPSSARSRLVRTV